MDDRLVIGHVVEKDGMKNLVLPKNVKATKAISKGIKEYLRKAGYKVSDKIMQWDLKEETMPKEDFKIIIGGNIDELEISCRRDFPTNTYATNMKLTIVFADMAKGKILYQSKVESSYTKEYFWFSEENLGEQAGIALGDAIEKLFEDKTVAQKLKEAIAINSIGLLKNAHLLCCAANRTAQRMSIYASRFGFLRALHLSIFEQPRNKDFFTKYIVVYTANWQRLLY